MSAKSVKNYRGFTLVEVLVAIAIVGFTIPAFLLLMGKQTDNADSLRNKAIATWVAENTLTRLRLERKISGANLRSTDENTVTMAGIEWKVITEPEETETGALLRYRSRVGLAEDDNPLITLDAFVH